MRIVRIFLFFPMVFIILLGMSRAETVFLKSGAVIEGPVLEKTGSSVKVDIRGTEVTFYDEEIERIEGSKVPETEPIQPWDQVYKESVFGSVYVKVKRGNQSVTGSGFIVDPGLVVTNFHVVVKAEEIEVELKDGRVFPVEGIVDYNATRDFCILKINADNLTDLSLGDSDRLLPGQKIMVIGAPAGKPFSISEGVYSGRRKFCGFNHLQLTAPISPGNSGGPVLDVHGKVIGIATFKRITTTNYSFSIPINEIKDSIHDQVKLSIPEFNQGISRAYEFYDEGQGAYFKGDLTSAVSSMEKAVSADPTYLEAWYGLGELYLAANKPDEALATWKTIVEKDPENIEAHINLGTAYFNKKLYDEAMKECQTVIGLDPQSVEAYDNLGVIYGRQKFYDKAIQAHLKALNINGYFPRGHYNLATAYYNKGDYAKAIEHCDTAIRLGYEVGAEFLEMLKSHRKK